MTPALRSRVLRITVLGVVIATFCRWQSDRRMQRCSTTFTTMAATRFHPEMNGRIGCQHVHNSKGCSSQGIVSPALVFFGAVGVASSVATWRCSQSAASRVARSALTDEKDRTCTVLLDKYKDEVEALRKDGGDLFKDFDDIYVLRYVLENKGDTAAAVKQATEVMEWRTGEGKPIVEAAAAAFAKATADGKWNNEPVFAAAPHSEVLSKYLTASQIILVSFPNGDMCSCIRASTIDDKQMMNDVSIEELTEFFIYAREVNFLVAESRTRSSGRLVALCSANDLSGVNRFPDDRFQKALTGSSKKATTLYPALAGPTLILNLPGIVRLLVQFLTPLFPGAVQAKIKFARGPMAYLKDLKDATKEPIRSQFISDLEAVLDGVK